MRQYFDSVSCGPDGILERSLVHLKVNPRFTQLCLRIAANKKNQVITAYGLTDEYSPKCGLGQGGVECPLLWRIVYEVLLSVFMGAGLGYPVMRREALAEHHRIPVLMPETPDVELMISCLAFVIIRPGSINPKKSELLVINPTLAADELTIQLGNDVLRALSPGTSARMLGVWFSADGKGVYARQVVQQEVSLICKILARKAITDKQAIYIVNNVLIPRILYRLTTTILTASEVTRIVGQYSGMIRQNLGLPSGTPNSILHHRRLHGLRPFGDSQEEEQISTALLRLNDHGLVRQVMEARFLAHQVESTPLPAKTCRKITHQLAKDKVVYLQDVTTVDGAAIASWLDLKQRLQIKGQIRRWYHMLPAMNTMHARHPDLYPDSVCRVCNAQDEDNNHVWIHHEIGDEHAKIWEEALTCIDGLGRAATTSYNKERQQQYERDFRNGKPHTKKPTPVSWICPA
ncbi:hypothetical protein BGX20_004197 [Mortierella sp. AD010]|nr:hypothetical protein BGX20_004197 [Mortierella sp. AD010]